MKFDDLARPGSLTPEVVFNLIVEYFKWAEENPLNTPETASFQGIIRQGEAAKIRPFSIGSMCLFIGINPKTWRQWRNSGSDNQKAVVEWAEAVIHEQKYNGAMAGFFNSNFVMKDLEMDVSTVKTIGDANNPIEHRISGEHAITIDQAAVDALLSKL